MRWYEVLALLLIFTAAIAAHVFVRSGVLPCNHRCHICGKPLEAKHD
jgi:hypothetical protein